MQYSMGGHVLGDVALESALGSDDEVSLEKAERWTWNKAGEPVVVEHTRWRSRGRDGDEDKHKRAT